MPGFASWREDASPNIKRNTANYPRRIKKADTKRGNKAFSHEDILGILF